MLRKDPKDPFAARQRAVDAALRSKSHPVVQEARAAEDHRLAQAADSGGAVGQECAAAAAWNGTPEVGGLPLGMGAPVLEGSPGHKGRPAWARDLPKRRKRQGPIHELTQADAEVVAMEWLRRSCDATKRTSGWRRIARDVVRMAEGHYKSVPRREGEAMRSSSAWAHAVAEGPAAPRGHRGPERWMAIRLGREIQCTRRGYRMVARAILRAAALARGEVLVTDVRGSAAG